MHTLEQSYKAYVRRESVTPVEILTRIWIIPGNLTYFLHLKQKDHWAFCICIKFERQCTSNLLLLMTRSLSDIKSSPHHLKANKMLIVSWNKRFSRNSINCIPNIIGQYDKSSKYRFLGVVSEREVVNEERHTNNHNTVTIENLLFQIDSTSLSNVMIYSYIARAVDC